MFSPEEVLRVFLPNWLFDYFELEKFDQSTDQIDVYLGEKKITPSFPSTAIISYGFTDYSIVQDFSISKMFTVSLIAKCGFVSIHETKPHFLFLTH